MSVFMYAPGFKIYISTEKNGILDISDDVTQGSIVRRSAGVSSLSFTLQNARRKYDGVFVPNDRIIVMMKRLAWMRVFTGYLNAVPLVTAWPMAVQMTASCSLKRLQYYYWDPGLASSQTLVTNAMASTAHPDDGGTANAIITLLQTVAGWPAANTHIAGIPQAALQWSYGIAKNVQASLAQADALAQQFYSILGANGAVGGVTQGGTVISNALNPGTYGGTAINAAQTAVAIKIYNAGASLGASSRDKVVALAVAMATSALGTNMSGPGGAAGAFGLQPSKGWGTAAQVADTTYSATKFLQALMTITNRDSMTIAQEGQAVLKTTAAQGANYQKYASMGTQIVNILTGGAGSSLSVAPVLAGTSPNKTGKTTANALLATALALVQQHPSIPYQEGGDSPPNTPAAQVRLLDCSSFVQWCYFHANGSLGSCPRTSQAQSSWCQSGGSIVTAAQGMKTQGALMFMGSPGSATHVEISLGDGTHTVGAHHSGTFAGVVSSSGAWTCAGIAPGLDYSGAGGPASGSSAGGAAPANPLNAGVQLSTGSAQPWYNPSDPFDSLFGSSPFVPEYNIDTVLAEALTGPRALLPDSPLLPYIKNLVSSCMRQFCSAPNGDFIAWFPDYYGLWGTAAIMQIEPIELQDFNVWWDDTNLVTHQFTVNSIAQNAITLDTGTVANMGPLLAVTTTGVASIDIPAIMQGLFGLEPSQAEAQKFISWVYKRFGARPDFQTVVGPVGPQGEFFSAIYLFMQSWAYQYNADIPITFMPELWPGMLVQIPAFGFQAYVTTVTHNWQTGPGGGYSTTVNIAAPARLPGNEGNSQGALIGMPLAGGLTGSPSPPTIGNTPKIPNILPTPTGGPVPGSPAIFTKPAAAPQRSAAIIAPGGQNINQTSGINIPTAG